MSDRILITSLDQIPDFDLMTWEEEADWWERAEFADGVLEESPEVEAEVDAVLGIKRATKRLLKAEAVLGEVRIFPDPEAGVWVATCENPACVVTEADSFLEAAIKVARLAQELHELNEQDPNPARAGGK